MHSLDVSESISILLQLKFRKVQMFWANCFQFDKVSKEIWLAGSPFETQTLKIDVKDTNILKYSNYSAYCILEALTGQIKSI